MCLPKLSLLFFAIFAAWTTNQAHASIIPRILGGKKAELGDLPYQVSVTIQLSDGPIYCSGSIISNFHVITSAACFVTYDKRWKNINRIIIRAGAVNELLSKIQDQFIVDVDVEKIHIPAEFFKNQNRNHISLANIAILKLKESLNLESSLYLSKLNFPPRLAVQDYFAGKTAVVSGYGWNNVSYDGQNYLSHTYDHNLRYAYATVVAANECKKWMATFKPQYHICARTQQHKSLYPQGEGVCWNDFGAPLVYNNMLIGVLNSISRDCKQDFEPVVYVHVSAFFDFIIHSIYEIPDVRSQTFFIPIKNQNQ